MKAAVELISPQRIGAAIRSGDWRDFTDAELLTAVLALREWEQRREGPVKAVLEGLHRLSAKALDPEESYLLARQSEEVNETLSAMMDDVAVRDLVTRRMAPAAFPVGDRHTIWAARDIGAQVLATAGDRGIAAFHAKPAAEHGLVFDSDGAVMLQRLATERAYPYLDGFALPSGTPCDDLVDVVSVYGDRYLVSKADILDPARTRVPLRDQLGHKLSDNHVRPENTEVVSLLHKGNLAAVRDVEFHDDTAVVYAAPWAQRLLEVEAALADDWLDVRGHALDLERDLLDPLAGAEVSLDGAVNRPITIGGVKIDCWFAPRDGGALQIGASERATAVAVREGMAGAVETAVLASVRQQLLERPAGPMLPRVKALTWPVQGDHNELVGVYDSLGRASREALPGYDGAPLWFVDEAGVRLGEALAHRDTDPAGAMPETMPRSFRWEPAGLERLAVEAAMVVAPSLEAETEEGAELEP